ncbi:methylated-DNA--[protein]-cysteine S-methyltransferase [Mycoavidus sp. B2-EB]|uniref:methylated-DNA--[protein]-cysteine S-methyltransferase n=1 Tax=Mycoavidus sp. B2-EB TaxID=2651972 RepID=UPI001623EE98|nr:methylated-DNA--[protein]-cysteine S-methyltransferase [Mycoavidus sp. B2-EB]BBO60208.1 methylated-DNA--protein-cysteine methyltransferase [Mycoavidus sp. B2-EB]
MQSQTHYFGGKFSTPLGQMTAIVTTEGALARLAFAGETQAARRLLQGMNVEWQNAKTAFVQQQIEEYFLGQRAQFDLPLAPLGTAFQLRVWQQLTAIPYGTTLSYGELARILDCPTAARAVGAANGANQIAVIIPCHRVIGANGSLTGYAGGLHLKQALLTLEQAH